MKRLLILCLILSSIAYEEPEPRYMNPSDHKDFLCLILQATKKALCIDMQNTDWLYYYDLDDTLNLDNARFVKRERITN